MFSSDGTFLKQRVKADTPFARDLALSPGPDQTFLYVGNGDDIQVLDRQTLDILGAVKVPGQIGGGHHLATDSKGNLYIAQTAAGLQKLTFKGLGR
jgi:DNA-binding beta-propeller fold protein YncE